MTVTSTVSRNEFVGDGSTTEFIYRNKIFATSDLEVYLDGVLQTLTTHYTVSIDTDDNEATVTFVTAPSLDVSVVIVGNVPNTQESDYPAGGPFPSVTTENALDRRTLVAQRLQDQLARSLKYLASDANLPSATLPTLEALKGKVLGFSASTGAPVVLDPDTLGGGVSTSGPNWGSDYDLSFGAGTDQAEAVQALLDAAGTTALTYGPQTVRIISTGGALTIGARLRVPANVTLDVSQTKVELINDAEISIFGEYEELPETNLFRLAADAEPGDATITVDASDYGSYALLAADAFGVLRGENDINGNAIQRHEFRIVSTDDSGGISALVITIDPPIPDDQGTFTPINEDSAWEPGESGIDRSLVTVRTASLVDSNIARGDISFDVADGSLFTAGTVAMLQDDRLASDPGDTDNGQPMRQEMVRIRSISTNTITLEQRVSRDFLTSENAALIKIAAIENAHIIAGKIERVEASPASPASRKHAALMYFADRCSISGVDLDEDDHTYSVRGQAARATRSIDCKIFNVRRIGPKNADSGDGNGIGNYYSTNTEIFGCYTERCRHGMTNQGSTRANRHDNIGVNNLINTLDDHGVYETDTWDHDNRAYGGGSLASGSTQQLGATYGNTRWSAGSHYAVSEGNVFANLSGTSDGGIAIRVGCTDFYEKNVYVDCTIPIRIAADKRHPAATISDISINGWVDGGDPGLSIDGRMQVWASEDDVSATEARPVYIDDSTETRRYVTKDTGTLGTVNPTHTTGTETSGDIDLEYVGLVSEQDATIDGVVVLADLSRAGTEVAQNSADNVTRGASAIWASTSGSDLAATTVQGQLDELANEVSGSGLDSVTTEWSRLDLSVDGGVATIGDTYIAHQSDLDAGDLTNSFVETPLIDPSSTSADVTCNLDFGSDAGGEHIVCVMPLDLTGTITLRSSDYATGGLVDGQASITAPGSGYFTIERLAGSTKHFQTSLVPAPTFTGLSTFSGGVSLPVLAGVSGTLTLAEHSGHTLILTDDATIPVTDGFMARFIASGASRDIDAGGAALSLADGDSVVIWTDGTTVWRSATETLATMATS